jgi:carbonic anhydrase/acetyltransferase-like protein (isoleucine patch superfamily)
VIRTVGWGAIVVFEERVESSGAIAPGSSLFSEPLAYCDVLGCNIAERIIERFVRAEADVVSVLCEKGRSANDGNESERLKPSFTAFENVEFQCVSDPFLSVREKLQEYVRNGIEHAFLLFGNIYAETDLLDLFYFHRESRRPATRALCGDGALDLWVVDCAKAQDADLADLLTTQREHENHYFIREYVNRLAAPRDLRQFAADLLRGRCVGRPSGREVKRGIWIDDGAEVHRRARIVAPAYIGRNTQVMQDALITRSSNIERDCLVEYGTVVEDSSILQGTAIGICLDVCHAIASRSKFLNLDRQVVIEISDPSVMRQNGELTKPLKERGWARNLLNFSRRKQPTVAELQESASALEQCRLQSNPLQG